MTPGQLLWVIRAVGVGLVLLFGFWVKAKYDELVTLRKEFTEAQLQLTNLKAQFDGFDEAIAVRVREEVARRGVRAQINNRLEQAANENVDARDYLGQRVPDSVRSAYVGGALHPEADSTSGVDADGRASPEP